jgi:hypothetical protein
MSLVIQKFETRPVGVEAVLWDGSKKSAKQIIKMLTKRGISASYSEYVSQNDSLAVVEETFQFSIRVYQNRIETEKSNIDAGDWVVIYPNNKARVLTAEKFADEFRVA